MPHRTPPRHPRRHRAAGRLAALLAAFSLLGGCGKETPPDASGAPTPAVVVTAARDGTVEEQAQFVGRVAAMDKVDIQARVQGFIKERKFTEGQEVKAGDLLYLIEPEQYQSVVRQREADLAKAVADEQNARAQLSRGLELVKQKNVSQAEVDKLQAAQSIAKAGISQAQAALDAARLDLTYTRILAPLAGRIGMSRYSVGSLVGPSSDTLVTIVSVNPIYVTFPVTQRELLETRRDIQAGGGNPAQAVVLARLPDDTLYEHQGKINFLDVVTDRGTDTVTVRALFPNPQGILIDGQFVGVLVQDDQPTRAILIPAAALQIDQQGTYVLVVDGEKKVEVRRIVTGAAVGSDMVVSSGLAAGDLVITEGVQKVRPGMVVNAVPATDPAKSAQAPVSP